MRKIASNIFRYFLQGLVFLLPLIITLWLVYAFFDFVDTIIPGMQRGYGFLIIIVSIVLVGWFGSRFFLWKWIQSGVEQILERFPVLNNIYTSIKDFVEGFMGDKRKFTEPVLVRIKQEPEIFQIGFVTQNDLTVIGLEDKIMVYFPHAYAISGYMYIVNKSEVKELNIDSKQAMTLAASGGVAGIEPIEEST